MTEEVTVGWMLYLGGQSEKLSKLKKWYGTHNGVETFKILKKIMFEIISVYEMYLSDEIVMILQDETIDN